jgi:hypothetical protein
LGRQKDAAAISSHVSENAWLQQLSENSKRLGRPFLAARGSYCSFAYSALASLRNGDVGVGVFPERKEALVGGHRFGGVAGEDIGSGKSQMRECADGLVPNEAGGRQ